MPVAHPVHDVAGVAPMPWLDAPHHLQRTVPCDRTPEPVAAPSRRVPASERIATGERRASRARLAPDAGGDNLEPDPGLRASRYRYFSPAVRDVPLGYR